VHRVSLPVCGANSPYRLTLNISMPCRSGGPSILPKNEPCTNSS
jgi:hypothetical protein